MRQLKSIENETHRVSLNGSREADIIVVEGLGLLIVPAWRDSGEYWIPNAELEIKGTKVRIIQRKGRTCPKDTT